MPENHRTRFLATVGKHVDVVLLWKETAQLHDGVASVASNTQTRKRPVSIEMWLSQHLNKVRALVLTINSILTCDKVAFGAYIKRCSSLHLTNLQYVQMENAAALKT